VTPEPLVVLSDWIRQIVRDELRRAQGDQDRAPAFLTTREAGGLARVAPGTIRRWIRAGKLVAVSAGREVRVRRTDLEALMTGNRGSRERSPEAQAMRDFALDRR
jgi:excisionase family DNA binding protein